MDQNLEFEVPVKIAGAWINEGVPNTGELAWVKAWKEFQKTAADLSNHKKVAGTSWDQERSRNAQRDDGTDQPHTGMEDLFDELQM